MSDIDGGPGREPEDVFENLRDRPTAELDSHRLWRRIEARLTPRSAGLWARLFGAPAPRLVVATAAVVVLVLVVWAIVASMQPPDARFVPLTAAQPETPDDAMAGPQGNARVTLDVRLVRGFDGAPPDDVRRARALGVGGADVLADVRTRIETLLPYADFGVVGAWQGAVVPGDPLDIDLSDPYRLVARFADTDDGSVIRLDGAELVGAAGTPVSGDLSLEPGRLYILGVVTPGAGDPELVLLIRARVAGQEGR